MVSRCFPGGYNVKLYISRGRLAWWLWLFLCCVCHCNQPYNVILILDELDTNIVMGDEYNDRDRNTPRAYEIRITVMHDAV